MRTCEVAGCPNKHVGRGMCSKHYQAWRATSGVPSPTSCGVEGCTHPARSRGYCGNHARNLRQYGSPIAPDRKGRNHPKWAGSTPTYAGAHYRARSQYGPPQAHGCVDCGGMAAEWAYDHLDEAELTFESPKGPIRYSANPAHYMAMCKPCHARFDRRAHQLLTVA